MVGRELHTICPLGEDHQGLGRVREGRNEDGNKENGKKSGILKNWRVILTVVMAFGFGFLLLATNYISPGAIWALT